MKRLNFLVLAASVAVLFLTGGQPAYAHDNDWNSQEYREHGHSYHNRSHRGDVFKDANFNRRDRRELFRRFYEAYDQKCGARKLRRYNDCDHDRYYRVGSRLSTWAKISSVPDSISVMLPRPISHTQYVWVDRDILLISRADRIVLDRIVSLR